MQNFSMSAIESTAMISFSAVQGRLLSKLAPSTMHFAACSMSAVSSTTAGGLPAPAPIAFFPELSTALTMPGPPVATSIRTFGWAIIALVFSSDGAVTVTTRLSGAPAARSMLTSCLDVLPRTMLSSTTTRRLPAMTDGSGLSLMRMPICRISWVGWMNVRPT